MEGLLVLFVGAGVTVIGGALLMFVEFAESEIDEENDTFGRKK